MGFNLNLYLILLILKAENPDCHKFHSKFRTICFAFPVQINIYDIKKTPTKVHQFKFMLHRWIALILIVMGFPLTQKSYYINAIFLKLSSQKQRKTPDYPDLKWWCVGQRCFLVWKATLFNSCKIHFHFINFVNSLQADSGFHAKSVPSLLCYFCAKLTNSKEFRVTFSSKI